MTNIGLILFGYFCTACLVIWTWNKTTTPMGLYDRGKAYWTIKLQYNTAPHSLGLNRFEDFTFRGIYYHYQAPWPYYDKGDLSIIEFYNEGLGVAVAEGESVYLKGELIFAHCSRKNLLKTAKLACMDAVKGTQVINSTYFPELLPSWVNSESVQEKKLVGWYRSSAIFHGSCRFCFYAFDVGDNYLNSVENENVHNYLGGEMPSNFYVYPDEDYRLASSQVFDSIPDHARFSVEEKHMVIDHQTLLAWSQLESPAINPGNAQSLCASNDMRLPSISELKSLHDTSQPNATPCGEYICEVSPLFQLNHAVFFTSKKQSLDNFQLFDLVNRIEIAGLPRKEYGILCVKNLEK